MCWLKVQGGGGRVLVGGRGAWNVRRLEEEEELGTCEEWRQKGLRTSTGWRSRS